MEHVVMGCVALYCYHSSTMLNKAWENRLKVGYLGRVRILEALFPSSIFVVPDFSRNDVSFEDSRGCPTGLGHADAADVEQRSSDR